MLDGFEKYNSGVNCFRNNRALCSLQDLPSWCNSDAHRDNVLDRGYNITDSEIEKEKDLIEYIKSGNQPDFFIK